MPSFRDVGLSQVPFLREVAAEAEAEADTAAGDGDWGFFAEVDAESEADTAAGDGGTGLFEFHFDRNSYYMIGLSADAAAKAGNSIMEGQVGWLDEEEKRMVEAKAPTSAAVVPRGRRAQEESSGYVTFNDLWYYISLLSEPEFVMVYLAGVTVLRNSYVLGIQATYRCIKWDGTVVEKMAPRHRFKTGMFAGPDAGGNSMQSISLRDGEALVTVTAGQGLIVDALQFTTSLGRRSEHMGGPGGDPERCWHFEAPSSPNHKAIVAFAGLGNWGAVQRIGFYTLPRFNYSQELPKEFPASLQCPVCQEPIESTDRGGYMLTPCNHLFHRPCLSFWMFSSIVDRQKMDCPLCRGELPP